jgi:Protein of unknown function (DUF2808)
MRLTSWLGLAIASAGSLLLHSSFSMPTQAVQLQNGTTYFTVPPQLVSASATEKRVSASGVSYYFTLSVPTDAGEPLRRVEIVQRDGSIHSKLVQFDAEESRAFVGTQRDRGADLTLGENSFDRDSQTLSVVFDPPVPPGTVVTLDLRPKRNPLRDGIYLFGVTAYPEGKDGYGQFLGYGRLQFDGSDLFPFF